MIDIYDLHTKMTRHLFPEFSSTDEHFLSLALCGEVGELVDIASHNGAIDVEKVRDEIADIRVYLELLAKRFNIEGDKLQVTETLLNYTEGMLLSGLTGKTGLLANLIKKRWRDGVEMDDECRALIRVIRNYLEALAERVDIGGAKLDERVQQKLQKVVEKHKGKFT